MKKTTTLLCLLFTATLFGYPTNAQNKSKPLSKSLEKGDAKDIRTDIDFFSGKLYLDNTTDELAECQYSYQEGYLRPDMKYKEVGSVGYLSIGPEERDKGINLDDDSNRWKLSLNKNLKNSLNIRLRAGEANIDLEDSNLENFNFKMTAGKSNINLRNTSIPHLKFNLLAGEAYIDLSGKWENNGEADIKGGIGEVTVKVPYETGVIVYVSGVLGEVNIPFFQKVGSFYTNDRYGKTKNTLSIYINGAVGQINIKMEE
jgi:hypothetical protein